MKLFFLHKSVTNIKLKNLFVLITVLISSCAVTKNKPLLYKSNIEVKSKILSKKEKNNIRSRLYGQLDDSAKTIVKDVFFVFHIVKNPPFYDTVFSSASAKNMKASLVHSGYYSPKVSFKADTTRRHNKIKVSVLYTAEPGIPTLIDTVAYKFQNEDIQELALKTRPESFLKKNRIVSKADILAEESRLIELCRNNGYYKFSSDNISVIGDTTIDLLTNISDDPLENLRMLAEAKEKRNKPTIKLGLLLNQGTDSSALKKYYINKVYIYPDFSVLDTANACGFTEERTKNHIIRFHKKIFKNKFLTGNNFIRRGSIYRQEDYTKTINSYSKTGVWQSVTIQLLENKDSIDKLDAVIQLVPAKKFGFEANIESSYSTNNNYTLGNLVGFSGNLSLQNRNVWKEGIKMTHAIHAGVEFNVSKNKSTNGIINSTDLGYSNTISVPRLVFPFKKFDRKNLLSKQSYINTSINYTNRFDLFKLQGYNFALGYDWTGRKNRSHTFKLINVEFSYLYNRSANFDITLNNNPYLKYSFTTSLVMGTSYGYAYSNFNKTKKIQKDYKFNVEESGIPWSLLGIFKNYLRKFVKLDGEITKTRTYAKSSHVFRLFGGVGIPIGKSDSSLPFFKQYYSGGANSMRGWPVRGIGQGARPMPGYKTTTFNDRTGDVKLEANYEYRYNIAQIIPNTLFLKGALFVDAGNVWNFRNTVSGGGEDSLQFVFKNLYKQLGVCAGTGFRFDFNYFLIRFDLGFRFKRPDIAKNNGWQLPDITFNNLFKKGVNVPDLSTADPNDKVNDERYKKWRYENFNFTIGISYPF